MKGGQEDKMKFWKTNNKMKHIAEERKKRKKEESIKVKKHRKNEKIMQEINILNIWGCKNEVWMMKGWKYEEQRKSQIIILYNFILYLFKDYRRKDERMRDE